MIKTHSLRDLSYARLGVLIGTPGRLARPAAAAEPAPMRRPPADEEALLEQAEQHRPELIALRRAVEAAREQVALAHDPRLPQLAALGRYTHTEGEGFVLPTDAVFIGAQLSWTAFAWGRGTDAVDAARAALDEAQARLDQAIDGVRLEIEADVAELTSALAADRVARRGVAAARESLNAMEGRHKAGGATMSELLSAQASLVRAESSEVAARVATQRAEIALEHAVGTDPWTILTERK